MADDPITTAEQIQLAMEECVMQARVELAQGRFVNLHDLAASCACWAEALSYLEE